MALTAGNLVSSLFCTRQATGFLYFCVQIQVSEVFEVLSRGETSGYEFHGQFGSFMFLLAWLGLTKFCVLDGPETPTYHGVQVFINTDSLAKFISLRTRYLFAVLPECLTNVPDFSVQNVSAHISKLCNLFNKLDSELQKDRTFVGISACDALLTSTEWASTWHSLLTQVSSVDQLLEAFCKKLGFPAPATSKDLPRKSIGLGGGGGSHPELDAKTTKRKHDGEEGDEERNRNEDGTNEKVTRQQQDAVEEDIEEEPEEGEEYDSVDLSSLQCVNSFRLQSGPQEFLEQSPEAEALRLDRVPASFVRRFELELEKMMWMIWPDFSAHEGSSVILNLAKTSKSEAIMVKYPVDPNLSMPFRGRVTCNPSGVKAPRLFLTKAFGIKFFLEPPQENICVPAWSVKTTARHDLAYFQNIVHKVDVSVVRRNDVTMKPDEDAEPEEGQKQFCPDPDGLDFHLLPLKPAKAELLESDQDVWMRRRSGLWLSEEVSWLHL